MEEYTGIIVITMLIAILLLTFWSIIETIHNFDIRKQEYKSYMKEIVKFKPIKLRNAKQYYYQYKGISGEFETYKILHKKIKGEYIFYNDVYIPKNIDDEKGETTETDFIIIHEKAIFVLEVKNLYGEIFGNKGDRDWHQKIDKSNINRIYNPILQNENHIKYLVSHLDLAKYKITDKYIYSIIVFGNDSIIDAVRIDDANLKVLNIDELEFCMNNIIESNDYILEPDDINEIDQILNRYENVDDIIKDKHRNTVMGTSDN